MTLLAIDPGPTETAWVFLTNAGRLDLAVVPVFGKADNEEFLEDALFAAVVRRADVVIEEIEHYGKDMNAGRTTFETCRWNGRFEQRFIDAHSEYGVKIAGLSLPDPLPWHRLPRRKVKQALCGMGSAKDKDIRTAVLDRLGPQGTKKAPGPTYGVSKDVWQAIGLGLAWLDLRSKDATAGDEPPAT